MTRIGAGRGTNLRALVALGTTAMGFADSEERITGRPSVIARLMSPLTGH